MSDIVSETAKSRHLTRKYCRGNGVDVGSGGDPVVPWAIQTDLSDATYASYNSGALARGPIQIRSDDAFVNLPLKDGSLDFVYSSHLIEDFLDWDPLLIEWRRVLKPGGFLVICLPDKVRWNQALANGQMPNCAHKHESYPGELTTYAIRLGQFRVIEDRLTECFPGDYNILFAAQKV